MFRPNHALTNKDMAAIGTRLLDLRPMSVLSTVMAKQHTLITTVVYVTEGISHMDLTTFAINPSYPYELKQTKMMLHTEAVDYLEIIPLLDACMTTALQNLKELWP